MTGRKNAKTRKPLGVVVFPRLPPATLIEREGEPWRLSDKALARIEEIEAHQRRSWHEVMFGNFWLD